MRKLSLRLDTLLTMIPNGYDAIWDCCCDHGYLGMSILNANLTNHVYFVDQVASITQTLEKKLALYRYNNYEVITESAANLTFNPEQKHLVIIAGVSGKTTANIISQIKKQQPNTSIDFLLSPNYHIELLKNTLTHLSLTITDTKTILDNHQTYDLFFIQ